MKVSFEGIGEVFATFYNNGAADGQPVKISGNGEVSPCSAGEKFSGIAVAPGEEYTGVVIGGCITVPYSGTAPALGHTALVADGNGGVKSGAGGNSHTVINVDTAEKSLCFIL